MINRPNKQTIHDTQHYCSHHNCDHILFGESCKSQSQYDCMFMDHFGDGDSTQKLRRPHQIMACEISAAHLIYSLLRDLAAQTELASLVNSLYNVYDATRSLARPRGPGHRRLIQVTHSLSMRN